MALPRGAPAAAFAGGRSLYEDHGPVQELLAPACPPPQGLRLRRRKDPSATGARPSALCPLWPLWVRVYPKRVQQSSGPLGALRSGGREGGAAGAGPPDVVRIGTGRSDAPLQQSPGISFLRRYLPTQLCPPRRKWQEKKRRWNVYALRRLAALNRMPASGYHRDPSREARLYQPPFSLSAHLSSASGCAIKS